ncbi:MAG: alpha/beta hydrolase [Terracidiphilus sp.]|jgi:pimeloyl-ACP methyl ester carboxylesterase
MTQFLDVRLQPVGGGLAASVAINQGASLGNYVSLSLNGLLDSIRGRHILLAAHGFNVNRSDGIDCLSKWESLLQLPEPYSAFVGLLWPGDSVWAHGLDYPGEPKIADEAGSLFAAFIDENFQDAASVSFASHSLGARAALATISRLSLPVRRLTLMAPAIDDNCLMTEFQAAAAKIGTISVLASSEDSVLSMCFPLGNFFAGIIDADHPWWRAALGNRGPAKPWPANFQPPFELPNDWKYQHGNYLQIDTPPPSPLPLPVDVPPQGSPPPGPVPPGKGWQEAFSSAFASTRFR